MNKQKQAQLTEGPVGKTIIRLTIPMFFGILASVSFNLIDTFFVGQLGTTPLAAMSFTFPVVFVISGLSMGLGVGASAIISRAIGEGDQYRVRRLTTDSLALSVIIVAVFIVAGFLTVEPVFKLMGATDQVLPYIESYMYIWYPGMIFMVVPMVGNFAIRATGDTKTPSMIMFVAVIINAILDPLLIYGWGPFPRMELAGAALATVISRGITFFFAIWILYAREKMITVKIPEAREVLESWKNMLYIGLPTAGTNIILPVGAGIITRLVSTYGHEAVAAFGVASRIDMFAMTVIMALSSVLGPFIGQNLGADNPDRVREGVIYGHRFALVWGVFVFLVLIFVSEPVASIFNDDPKVIEIIVLYLWIVPIGYGALGILSISNGAFNVLKKPLNASLLTITRMFVLYVPLAYFGSYLMGLKGIFSAATAANIITGVAAYFWLKKTLRK